MFCSNCGNELSDGQKFCNVCGTPVATAPKPVEPAVKENVTVQQTVAETVTADNYNWGESDSVDAVSQAKENIYSKALGSVPMLLLCIFYSVSVLYNLVTDVISDMNRTNAGTTLSVIVAKTILPIVMCVGLWIIFIVATQKRVNKGGVVCVKVASIINLVFRCILDVCVILLCAFSAVGILVAGSMGEVSRQFTVSAGVFCVVAFILIVIYIVAMILDIKSIANLCSIGSIAVSGVKTNMKTGLLRFIYMFQVVLGCFSFVGTLILSVMLKDVKIQRKLYEIFYDAVREMDHNLAFQVRDSIIDFIENLSRDLMISAFGTFILIFVHIFAFVVLGNLKKVSKN